jgi:hypothetical protein
MASCMQALKSDRAGLLCKQALLGTAVGGLTLEFHAYAELFCMMESDSVCKIDNLASCPGDMEAVRW